MTLSKSTKILLCVLMIAACFCVLSACNVTGGVTFNYTNADKYTVASEGQVDAIGNLNLDVDWLNGAVSIRSDAEATSISFKEIADGEKTTTATTMHYFLDGNTLRIKYAQSGRTNIGKLKKYLTVTVPASTSLRDVEVDGTSCDILLDGITAREVEIDSVSGGVSANCNALEMSVDTVSGNVSVFGNTPKVSVDTTSGSVSVKAEPTLYDLEVETVSGDVNLMLYPDNGFTMEFDTVTGLFANAFRSDTIQQGRIFTYRGGGICNYDVETVSGTLTINSVYIPPTEG